MDEKSDSDKELVAPSYTTEPMAVAQEQVDPGTGAYMQHQGRSVQVGRMHVDYMCSVYHIRQQPKLPPCAPTVEL